LPAQTSILHISLNARDPAVAADHLAALVGGLAAPFHPVAGAYVCFLNGREDWGAPLIELYPRDVGLSLRDGKMAFRDLPDAIAATGAHVNLAVTKTRAELEDICHRRGLARHWRDWQHLLEVWLDEDLLIECVPSRR
jgi:hypothetical protein